MNSNETKRLSVCEVIYLWTSAGKSIDGVDGSEKDAVGGDEARCVSKLQDVETLLVVQAGLPYT